MSSRRTDRLLQGLLALLVVAFLFVISDAFREQKVIAAGDSAPSFSVTTDSGRRLTRSDFGGKLLVLNFWATWCPPCRQEIPSLDAMQRELAPVGVVVLAVSVDKDEKQYRRFLQQNPVSFQTVREPDAQISADYGTYKYPESYIIDREGRVLEKVIGDQNWMDEKVLSGLRKYL